MKGLEIETNTILSRDLSGVGDRLSFGGALGYIDAKYTEFISNILIGGVNTPTDVSGFRQFQNTPKWTGAASLDYQRPAWGGRLNANATVSYRSKVFQAEAESVFDQKGFALVDANIMWRSPGDRYQIGLHGKNLFNQKYITSGYNFLNVDLVTGAPIRNSAGNFTPGAGLGLEGVLTAFYGNAAGVDVVRR